MADNRYIQYIVFDDEENEKGSYHTVEASFTYLEKYKDCLNWNFISNRITEETCTKEFYDTFDQYLNWNDAVFLSYIPEEEFYEKNRLSKIRVQSLFKSHSAFSEEFCKNYLKTKNPYDWLNIYQYIFKNGTKLSVEFIDDVFKYLLSYKTKTTAMYGRYIYRVDEFFKSLGKNQQITEEQFITYIENNSFINNLIPKFCVFVILSSPMNTYSIEFIKTYKRDLNQKAFFDTDQVQQYLSTNLISKNAINVFKTKINYVSLLNKAKDDKILENLLPECKKEIFDVLLKDPDKITNTDNLKKISSMIY